MTTQIERFRSVARMVGIDGNDVTMLSRLAKMGPDSLQELFNIYVFVHQSGRMTYTEFLQIRYLGIPLFGNNAGNETAGMLLNGNEVPFDDLRKELYRIENEFFPL